MNDYSAFRPPTAFLADAPLSASTLADRGTRLGAKLLDGVVMGGVGIVVGIAAAITIPALLSARHSGQALTGGILIGWLVLAVIGLGLIAGVIIWNCIWLHRYGQTVGKRAVKIKIVRSNGERASLGRIFALRYLPMTLASMIPFVGGIAGLADILFIFADDRRCLHDRIADTMVVSAE